MTKPALLWVLNLSDGRHSLLDIAERAGLGFQPVRQARHPDPG
jgi:aminopeptidase-like protein